MAKADPTALARLFEQSDAKRKKFHDKPKEAAKEAGLPDELADHFDSLNPVQRKALSSTWDELGKAGLKGDHDGVTVTFF